MNSDQEKALGEKIDKLIGALERVAPRKRVLIGRSFLHGIFVGLGATIGVSLVIAILTFLLTNLQVIPGIGDAVRQMQVEQFFKESSVK